MSDDWTMRDTCAYDFETADFPTLHETAETYGYYVWKTLHRLHDCGMDYLIILGYEPHSEYFESIPLGWYHTAETAVEDAINLLEVYKMKLHENHNLFPNITGVMLKNKVMKLTLSGNVQFSTLSMGKGNDSKTRVELSFLDHSKTAVVSATQAQNIINMYGDDTADWKGKTVYLFGEEGQWFGKWQWGVRVWDSTSKNPIPDVVKQAMKEQPKTNGRKPAPAIQYRHEVGAAVVVPGDNDEKPGEIVELDSDGKGKALYVVRVDGRDYRLSEAKFRVVEGEAVQDRLIDAPPNGYSE